MARNLHAMYEPPDLRTPQAAAHSTAGGALLLLLIGVPFLIRKRLQQYL